MRAAGVGLGGRPGGEPVVAGADGTLSLPGMPRAVRCEHALLGAESRAGTRLSALDIARLEDAGPRRLDRLERRAAEAQPAMDRQQWTVPDSAVGPRQRAGEQDPGAERPANAARLGSPIWVSSAAAGNAGGRQSLSRNLLPGCQLDLCRTDHRARPHGPGAQSSRQPSKTSTSIHWSAMPGNVYAAIPSGKQIQDLWLRLGGWR